MADDSAASGPSPADQENPLAAYRKAESLVRRRPLAALKALEPVLRVDPDKPSVQLLAARAYFHSAQLNRAERAFNRVLELDPADHYARFALGRTLQRLGRLVEALGQLRMASAMNPVPEYQEALGEVSARIAVQRG
ncbi:tetratricopeptide repeat protein [Tamaricihabitans halophyticus]|uniref:Tetratricopeptide repeat protein n=1 Tax=Tamaricihabitans halophyticus TaxID=1262583 RepID=A0A4R2R3D4_9PSEU|nr:tetratricopeptide repeat protein [Tamaricihabitans halophyticus]TCP56354.1 tetratricopeptide repeat protein [Tamaricihabitans halophyticus]